MLTKSKKEGIVKDLSKAIKKALSVVFVNFHGMKVSDETVLRRDLRGRGIAYKVSRKTLLKRVLDGAAAGTPPELSGEVAVVYLSTESSAGSSPKDTIVPAREILNFQKTHKGVLNILGGIFEGKFVDSASMTEIANIPVREVLLSKIAFLFRSPIQRLAVAISQVAEKSGTSA